MHKVNQVLKMDSDYLSREELDAAIKGLSNVDVLRLKKIAMQYTGNHDMEAEELLGEAVLRTLSGGRKTCPRDLPIVNFLAGVISSITEYERKKKRNAGGVVNIDDCERNDSGSTPEDDVLEKQLFKQLESFFDEDEEILLLLLFLNDGFSPPEIQHDVGWSETQYNTIRRRMRRKWNSHNIQELTP